MFSISYVMDQIRIGRLEPFAVAESCRKKWSESGVGSEAWWGLIEVCPLLYGALERHWWTARHQLYWHGKILYLGSRNSTDKSPTIKPFHSLINLSSKYLKTFPNPRFAGRAHTAPRFTNLVFQRAFWFRILIVFKCSCLRLSAPRCTYRKNIALNIYKSRRTRGGGWMEATPCSHSSACFILENLCSAFDTVWARR